MSAQASRTFPSSEGGLVGDTGCRTFRPLIAYGRIRELGSGNLVRRGTAHRAMMERRGRMRSSNGLARVYARGSMVDGMVDGRMVAARLVAIACVAVGGLVMTGGPGRGGPTPPRRIVRGTRGG